MAQSRVKGQALALVLIVVVVAIVVAFAISNRVIQDTQQQGEERASTRAETFAESAIDNLTSQIQAGAILPNPNGAEYAISTEYPDSSIPNTNTPLGICDPNESDISQQCDADSLAKILFYRYVLQFKFFDAENLEIFMAEPDDTVRPNRTNDSGIIIFIENNTSYDETVSKLLIKGFSRNNSTKELRPISECLVGITGNNSDCQPDILQVTSISCPTKIPVRTVNNTTTDFPDNIANFDCVQVSVKATQTAQHAIDLYRIRPILTKTSGGTEVPYVSLSVTGKAANSYLLPTYHMAMITAGVYSGTTASDQQVYQQRTRLVLLHKTVPEIADYVLYNGSDQPITK